LRATQSCTGLVATGVFRVESALAPTVYQIAARAPSGGAGLQVELAGFAPRGRVAVFLYGPKRGYEGPFVRPLPVAIVDGNGMGTYAVEAAPGDPNGQYGIWLNPVPAPCREAELCATFWKIQ
jgi:hypothetical protein